MGDEELVKYFIERTDQRLEEMDNKINELLSFKWQIIGGATAISVLINLAISVVVK